MAQAETQVKKRGHSLGMVIPKESADELDLKAGDQVVVEVLKKTRRDGFGSCKGAKSFIREDSLDRRQ